MAFFDSPVLEDHATVCATCFQEMEEPIMAARTSHLIHQPVVSNEDCLKYRGQWVAVAMTDGRVLASGDTELEVARQVDALGLSVRDYLMEPIPSCDTLIL